MKKRLPWFKMFPEAWLEDTRDLTRDQRGLYIDCLCLIYKYDGPIRDDDRWIAHQLHEDVRAWRAVKRALIKRRMLAVTPAGLINPRAERELSERSTQRSRKALAAAERETLRRDNPKLPFEINERRAQLCLVESTSETTSRAQEGLHARARSDHQTLEEEKKERSSSLREASPDDDRKLQPTIPADLVSALTQCVGEERAQRYVKQYIDKGFAAGAHVIEVAFPAWLKKTHQVDLGVGNAKEVAAAIISMCGKDAFGRPDLTLPKVITRRTG